MLLPFLDQLDSERKTVFETLNAFHPPFILAGGTAIMLQIGHRRSYDFDCFCLTDILPNGLVQKIKRILGNNIHIRTQSPELVTITTPNNIEVTFVCHPFRPLKPIVKTNSIPLFDINDLAANKAYTVGRRPAWRDYVDLFILMKWNICPIDTIISLAQRKFKGEFNAKLFLGQLTYFADIDAIETVFLKESYTTAEIKAFLEKSVKEYLKVFLG